MSQPTWTIAHAMWLAHRRGYQALLGATLFGAAVLYLVGPTLRDPEALNALGYLPMGLLIFITFVFCGFTETDPRGRFTGFPARLFTLPVSTRTLIGAPMLFSVATV